nr:hypothetical protein GZ11A10_46 [uncultured archaeon GZfos11A10]
MLKIAVSCHGPEEYEELEIDGQKLLTMRGGEEEKAIELKELLESINEEISGYITEPCDVTIELDGSTTYGGGGGVEALIIDIGGKVEKTSGIKITLNTKINPKK